MKKLMLSCFALCAFAAFGETMTIDVSELSGSVSKDGYAYDANAHLLTLREDRQFVLTGSSSDVRVYVTENVKSVTLNGLKLEHANGKGAPISLEDKSATDVVFALTNANVLVAPPQCAAIEVPRNATLTISADDDAAELNAVGGGAGKGDNDEPSDEYGDDPENGGEGGGAGIGMGWNADCGTIVILGGKVTAAGGNKAAGIGGGAAGGCAGNVEIFGGTILSAGGWGAAGIGSGYEQGNDQEFTPSHNGKIVISGGRVTAKGGDGGAGIGGGGYWRRAKYRPKGPDVEISGGTVSAKGGKAVRYKGWKTSYSPWDFGAGSNPDDEKLPKVVVRGGTVYATNTDDSWHFNKEPCQSAEDEWPVGGVYPVYVRLGSSVADAKVEVVGLPQDYDVKDLYANEAGDLCFYLPAGKRVTFAVWWRDEDGTVVSKQFWAAPCEWRTEAQPLTVDGLLVNGVAVNNFTSGPGWVRDDYDRDRYIIRLNGSVERYVLTGMASNAVVSVENLNSTKVLELKDLCLEYGGILRWSMISFGNACRGKQVRLELNGVSFLQGHVNAISLCDGLFCEIDAAAGATNAVLIAAAGEVVNQVQTAATGAICGRGETLSEPMGTVALRGGCLYLEGGGADWGSNPIHSCAGLYAKTNIVSGGTLRVLAGKRGLGQNPPQPSMRASEANIFTGGSVLAGDGKMSTEVAIRVAPTNGAGKAVHRVTVPVSGGTGDDRRVKISGIPDYGCKDIVALNGKAYLYLPDGDYVFTVNGKFVRATVNGADTEATDELGFTVNGTDVLAGPGEGWSYNGDDGTLMIFGAGTYVLSGGAMFDEVQVNVAGPQNPTVVLSNAVIFTEVRPALNVATGATLALAAGQVMMAGDAPETMRYTADWAAKTSILAGPGATITVKDGIPHVTDVVVSNLTGTVSWSAVTGGRAYRVLLGDDLFVGYTVEEGYFPRAENPLRYPAVGGDITVDANTIPTAANIPYRAWNPTTRQMEDRVCSGYEVVTEETTTFENGKWYAVTNTVQRGMITVRGAAHLILCDGAKLTAIGGRLEAGIAVAAENSLAVYGQALGTGELVAKGAVASSGIGGKQSNGSCGMVTIDGGRVTATGGKHGAGIGGEWGGAAGMVTINGGQVLAQGGRNAAGIGGGNQGVGGTVTINGGTVRAAGGSGAGIGRGRGNQGVFTLTIGGGSVKANIAQDLAKNSTPTNVYCVTAKCPSFAKATEGKPLGLEGLEGYGTNDIYVVEEKVCLWLPNGTYRFTLSDGQTTNRYCAVVKGVNITVEPLGPIGFFVNDVDIGTRVGTDWTYGEDRVLSLNGNGTYVLSGEGTNDVVQVKVAQQGATVVLSNAVVLTEGRPSLDIAQGAKLRMAGGASFLGTTNNAAAVSIAQGAELVVDLAPGANRLETMIGVFNYDAAAAVAGQGSVKVNGGTFFVWSDNRAVGVRQFAADASELMQAGDAPEEMRYTTEWTSKKCVLVGPSVSVTVKNGIPHASGFTVSNAVEAIAGEAIVGGTVYRVMIGDDVFVGYTLEEEYFSDAENPLVYASIEGDVTVDRTTIPTVKGILYRDWNAETQQMEDRLCVDYVGVTADTAAFEDGKWYVVTNTVLRHGTITVSGSAHLILCDDAKLTVTGTAGSAAIGLASDNELSIYGQRGCRGELLVSGGENGAGIGGGDRLSGGPVRIYGGIVTAQGGDCGAGIGGGMEGGGAVLSVRGGRISARGGAFAAGIGGGNGNAPGDVTVVISGGTVTAVGDENAEDIGYGSGGTGNENIRIYGGSVRARMPGGLPKDFSDSALYRVEVKCEGLKAGALNVEGLRGYGTNDVFAIDGRIYLWLPDGMHRFALSDGTSTHYYCAVIRGHDITVEPLGPNGFHVNGTDIAVGSGMGWTYGDNAVLSFNAGGRYVLSGRAADDAVQIKVGVADVELVLSNAVVFASGRPALYVEKDVSLLMAGGESCFAATNAPGGIPSPAMTVANQAALAIGLASGCDRREPSFGVFSYGLAAAINGTGSISVSNGTFAVWGDPQAAMVPIVCAADTLAMAAGDDPGTAKYVTSYGSEPYVLVAPSATVTVKDGIPHITGFTVSNAVGRIEGMAVAGGRAYRVMLGDDVFVGYTVAAGYTSRTANPLVYASVEGDITVDEKAFRFTENIPYRAWNEMTRKMEDRECVDYTLVTADTAAFEDGKWYAVRGTVSCGTITASGAAHLILCDGAKLTATGGVNEAGLAVTNGNALAIYGQSLGTGELVAKGDGSAAGIGSNSGAKGGAVTVDGGLVTATGGKYAAGIGGGSAGDGGFITINGGTVMAMGDGQFAHGEVTITDVADIGGGAAGAGATVTINGGSIRAETVRNAPTNGLNAAVYRVKAKCEGIGDQGSGIRVEGLEGYGTDGIRPIDGWVYLWLPNGTHRFTLSDGQTAFRYCAVVDGGDVTVEPLAPIGFFVNGEDIGENGIGDGWNYQDKTLTLGGAMTYVLSGEATNNEVQVRAAADGATAVVSNAFVFTEGRPAVEVAQGAALAIGAGQVMLAGESPETLWYATTCGVARCVRVVPGATVTVKDIPHVSDVVVSNLTGTVPGVPVAGGTAYRVMFGDSIFVGYAVDPGYISPAENPLVYMAFEGDLTVDGDTIPVLPDVVSYIGRWNGTNETVVVTGNYVVVDAGLTTLASGVTYVVEGTVTNRNLLSLSGPATLVVCDGATLVAEGGFASAGWPAVTNALSIHGQAAGDGLLFAKDFRGVDTAIHGITTVTDGIFGGTPAFLGGTVSANTVSNGQLMAVMGGNVCIGTRFAFAYDGGERPVYAVTCPVPGVAGRMTIEGLAGYCTEDVFPVDGVICLYLPKGEHVFTVNGVRMRALVIGDGTVAERDDGGYLAYGQGGELLGAFARLTNAVHAAANGGTVKMTNDCHEAGAFVLPEGAAVTLDGCGYRLTLDATEFNAPSALINTNAALCLTNIVLTRSAVSRNTGLVAVADGGVMEMRNCTVENCDAFVSPLISVANGGFRAADVRFFESTASALVEATVRSADARFEIAKWFASGNVCDELFKVDNLSGRVDACEIGAGEQSWNGCGVADLSVGVGAACLRGAPPLPKVRLAGFAMGEDALHSHLVYRDAPPQGGVVLDVSSPDARIGSVIVSNAFDVAVAPQDVTLMTPGCRVTADAGGNLRLELASARPYIVRTITGAQTNYVPYATMEEAIAHGGRDILLMSYEESGRRQSVLAGNVSVPVGERFSLDTVRLTVTTNENWTAPSPDPVTLEGTITVPTNTVLRLGNVLPREIDLGREAYVLVEARPPERRYLYFRFSQDALDHILADGVVVASTCLSSAALKDVCAVLNEGYALVPVPADEVPAGLSGALWLTPTKYHEAWIVGEDAPRPSFIGAMESANDAVGHVDVTMHALSYTNETDGTVIGGYSSMGRGITVGGTNGSVRLTVGSWRIRVKGEERTVMNPPFPLTKLNLDGSKLNIRKDSVLALADIDVVGAFTLVGEGVLNLSDYQGSKLSVFIDPAADGKPRRIAEVGATGKIQLAAGQKGELFVNEEGVWWQLGVTCEYKQIANGKVRVTIRKNGEFKDEKDVMVTTGRSTYTYDDGGVPRTFTLMAVYVDWANDDGPKMFAPRGASYETIGGAFDSFGDAIENGMPMPKDIRLIKNNGLKVRCKFPAGDFEADLLTDDPGPDQAPLDLSILSDDELEKMGIPDEDFDDPEIRDFVLGVIAVNAAIVAAGASGTIAYQTFKKWWKRFCNAITVIDLIRCIRNLITDAVRFKKYPLLYKEKWYPANQFTNLCARCAKDNGSGDKGNSILLRHAFSVDPLELGSVGFVKMDAEFSVWGDELARLLIDYTNKLDAVRDVVGLVVAILDLMISDEFDKWGLLAFGVEKVAMIIEMACFLSYRYEYPLPPLGGSLALSSGVKYDFVKMKFDALRKSRYLRAMGDNSPAGTVRTAPILVAKPGSTSEFDTCELRNFQYSSPSGLIYACSGATLVFKDFIVVSNKCTAVEKRPPIVVEKGATIWVCGKSAIEGIEAVGADLRIGYGPHGDDAPKASELTGKGTINVFGETGYGKEIGTATFPSATSNALNRIISRQYSNWVESVVSDVGGALKTVWKEKDGARQKLAPIKFKQGNPFSVSVIRSGTGNKATVTGGLEVPTKEAIDELPLEFSIDFTDSLKDGKVAETNVTVNPTTHDFKQEFDGLGNSQFFRLKYRNRLEGSK